MKIFFKICFIFMIVFGFWVLDMLFFSAFEKYPEMIVITRSLSVLILVGYVLVSMGFGSD